MPAVSGVLETALYFEDLERGARFYEELFGWKPMFGDERMRAYGVSPGSVLLLFQQGASRAPVMTSEGTVSAHDGVPGGHVALAIARADWDPWLRRLEERGVSIEQTRRWERGGQSMYFRDPEGNLVELATPGVWAVY